MHALSDESSPAAHSAASPPASPLRSSSLLLDHWGRCRLLLDRLLVLMLLPAAASLQEQLLWSRSPVMILRGYGRLRQNMNPSNYGDKSGQWVNSVQQLQIVVSRGLMTSRAPDVLLSSVQRAFIIKVILSPQQSLPWHDYLPRRRQLDRSSLSEASSTTATQHLLTAELACTVANATGCLAAAGPSSRHQSRCSEAPGRPQDTLHLCSGRQQLHRAARPDAGYVCGDSEFGGTLP